MVISKDGKRKRKEIIHQPLEQVDLQPKRTKVHAQRKFAQGQGSGSSSFPVTGLATSITPSQPVTPVKETLPPSELIPNKRPPHTEDFLTYLCFRGTPILPPHLDYFNANHPNPNHRGAESSSTTSILNNDKVNISPITSTTSVIDEKSKLENNVPTKIEKSEISTNEKDKESPTVFIPFGVRKRAEQIPDRKHREKVQALRKKYHEQRMAKLRTKRFGKNRSSIQTRSNPTPKTVSPEPVEIKKKKEPEKEETTVTNKSINQSKRKIGLRSGLTTTTTTSTETEKTLKQLKLEKEIKLSDEKGKEIKITAKKEASSKKDIKDQKVKIEEKEKVKEEKESVLTLRNRKMVEKSIKNPTKIKEIHRMTRQTKIRNPTKDEPKVESQIESEDFSSDDDEPLAIIKTTKVKDDEIVKMTRSKKIFGGISPTSITNSPNINNHPEVQVNNNVVAKKKDKTISRMNTRFSEVTPIRSNSRSQRSDVSSKISDNSLKKKTNLIKNEIKKIITKKTEVPLPKLNNIEKSQVKTNEDENILMKSDDDQSKRSISPAKTIQLPKKVGRKKKIDLESIEKSNEIIQTAVTTITADVNETEMRTARPTRKTKEAATIYMELIGRKLNLKETDFDDDAMSLDSFPELPNVRKTEQMENEMKSNYNKDKNKIKLLSKLTKDKNNQAKVKKEAEKDDVVLEVIRNELEVKKVQPDINKIENKEIKKSLKHKKINTKTVEIFESESDYEIGEVLKEHVKKKLDSDVDCNINNDTIIDKEKQQDEIKKLEKSFSDSDEEPLASKVIKKRKVSVVKQPSISLKVAPTEIAENKQIIIEFPTPIPFLNKSLVSTENKTFITKQQENSKSPIEKFKEQNLGNLLRGQNIAKLNDDQTSIKANRSSEFNSKSDTTPTKLSKSGCNEIDQHLINKVTTKPEEQPPQKIVKPDSIFMKQIKQTNINSMRDLMNPLPSQEESGKIFGIASVSLAQSSGPLDTKCTLGKCGSIHKPPLGPVVPTEAILGEHLTSKERRRAKVNMTHEQIQKWLVESSCTPDPNDMHDDFLDDEFDLKTPPKPISYLSSPSPTASPFRTTDEPSTSTSLRLTKAKQEKLFLSKEKSSSSVTKGPSLKAKPVLVKEEKRDESIEKNAIPEFTKIDKVKYERQTVKQDLKCKEKLTTLPKVDKLKIKEEIISLLDSDQKSIKEEPSSITSHQSIKAPTSIPDKKLVNSKVTGQNKKQQNSSSTSTQKQTITDRKLIFNQRRLPVYNTKIIPTETPKIKKIINTFGAFSPDNETSVYSFDKEDDVIPVATPFRRHSRRESTNSRQDDSLERVPINKKIQQHEQQLTPTKNNNLLQQQQQQQDVLFTLSPDDNIKSASIAVQTSYNLVDNDLPDLQQQQQQQTAAESTTISTQRKQIINEQNQVNNTTATANTNNDCNDSDSDGQTFYIPLQATNISKSDQIIQGVTVKLGTEGPDGPNQRVIMHAKLVTKTQIGSTSTAGTTTTSTQQLPESLNVQEMVKSLIASKESISGCSKSVPIGTVQPRFKSSDSNVDSIRCPSPQQSTSELLPRVNSNSSLTSQKSKIIIQKSTATTSSSNNTIFSKIKDIFPLKQSNNTTFPRFDDPAQMVEAPIFKPTEKEFQDPLEYIERISITASRFGVCKIIPPSSFKPECRLSDDMRFTAYNQYVHKMLQRWGPSAKELSAIKKYLATQSITLTHPPWIGGMEVDLPRLYHTVQELGGLSDVIEKKKWQRVAEEMCIPKTAHDRCTKLDDIYCKYLLPYDTLSHTERQKLFDEVEADWVKREAKARHNADRCANNSNTGSDDNDNDDDDNNDDDDDEDESDNSEGDAMECMVKGRSMPLSAFFRIARNTMSLWFKNSEPTTNEIEAEFWRHVAVRDSHVCVHSGSIDSSGWGYGFPTPGGPKTKQSICSKHPWNLKVLTNNSGSILRSLGPVMGVTVPTLQFGMLFSGCCWYRDPHGLPWIEYLHLGASKIWYGVPDEQSNNLRKAVMQLVPTHCQNKTIWLPSDTAMVPPHMLTERGVSLCRTEQHPGEFIIVFPRAYTSSVCTGYLVSESVYFGTNGWLESAKQDFKDIQESGEPPVFSLEQLLFAISSDTRSNLETLEQIMPMVMEMYDKEVTSRKSIKAAGVTKIEKLITQKTRKIQNDENECDICRANLYISMVKIDDDLTYCLQHTIKYLNNLRIKPTQCKLLYAYGIDEIQRMLENLKDRIIMHKKKLASKKQQQNLQQQQQPQQQSQQNKFNNLTNTMEK